MAELEEIQPAVAAAHAPMVTIVSFDEKKKDVKANEENIDGK